jgi:hypothetical protein
MLYEVIVECADGLSEYQYYDTEQEAKDAIAEQANNQLIVKCRIEEWHGPFWR